MLPGYMAIVGALVASIGGIYYLYETIAGKAKPNRITWLFWGLFPMITFIAQRSQGVKNLSWISLASGLTPLLVVGASFFNKKAFWKTTSIDYICMSLGLFGILLWAFTKNANLAILFSILADFAAGLSTVLKAKKHPETESWQAFAISTLGFGIGLLSVADWNFQNVAFVVYLFALNSLITVLASRKPSNKQLETETA